MTENENGGDMRLLQNEIEHGDDIPLLNLRLGGQTGLLRDATNLVTLRVMQLSLFPGQKLMTYDEAWCERLMMLFIMSHQNLTF